MNSSALRGVSPLRLGLWLAVLNLLWSPVNFMVHAAEGFGFSPAGLALVRWSLIAVVVGALLQFKGFRSLTGAVWPSRQQAFIAMFVGIMLIGPSHLFYYLALKHVQTMEGTVFNTTGPLWTALLAGWLLREQVSKRRWFAIAIAGVGTYITSVGFALPNLANGHAGWNCLYLLGVLLETLGGILGIQLILKSSGMTILAFEALGMGLGLALWSALFPSILPIQLPAFSLGHWWPMAYLVVCSGVLAFGVWYILVERAPISLMVISTGLQPPIAALIGWYALGESLSIQIALGGALVILGLGLAMSESLPFFGRSRVRRLAAAEEMAA